MAANESQRAPQGAESGGHAVPSPDTLDTGPKPAPADTGPGPAQTVPFSAPGAPSGTRGPSAAGVPSIPGYEILSELGRGGMGVVYKARQLSLKRVVALKMILSGAHAGAEELARFRSEAEAVARLQHPNVVQIHDIGECDGLSYFSLEFIEGDTLARRIGGKPAAVAQAAALVETLARAMHHAHERGIVHRDLKPANVLLAADGTPKITDFGLAKQLEADSRQTRTGAVMGTPSYMAPEQAAGDSHAIGPLSDVYALGAILYELLTGGPPFRGRTVLETLEQVRTREPVPPSRLRPGVPRDLETVCLKCLAKEPARRYTSALALANDLSRFRAGEPILARREGPVGRLLRRVRRHPRTAAAVLLGVVAAAAAGAFLVQARTGSRIATLQQAVRTPVAAAEWTEERLRQLEDRLDELAGLAPDVAAEERTHLYQRLYQAGYELTGELAAEGQDEALVARINGYVALLEARDAERARQLRDHLNKHLRILETVFKLEHLFANVASVFPPGVVRVEGGALRATASDKDLILTRRPSTSRCEIRAEFPHPDWKKADHLGVALNAAVGRGYTFVLRRPKRVPKRQGPPAPTPGADGGPPKEKVLLMQIVRNGSVLREQPLPEREVEDEPLRLWARRDGDRLTFQVNAHKPLEFYDSFPLGGADAGAFGVVWPAAVPLARLEALRQTQAPVPSALDEGDQLYERKQYEDALGRYRRQAATAGGRGLALEARYKAGMCLVALKRIPEARAELQAVTTEDGNRWPVLAASQLWLTYVNDKGARSQEEADNVLARLASRGVGFGELALVIPHDVRDELLAVGSSEPLNVIQTLTQPERTVRRVERRAEMVRLFDTSRPAYEGALLSLMFVYCQVGDEDRALAVGREILKAHPPLGHNHVPEFALERTGWILRHRGQADVALQQIEQHRARAREGQPGADRYLLLERARTLAALGRAADAEHDIDEFLRARGRVDELTRLSAAIMKGFFREQANDAAGAREAWRKGAAAYPLERMGASPHGEGSTVLSYSIAASLSGVMGEDESRKVQGWLFARLSGTSQTDRVLAALVRRVPATVVRDMWRGKRGRDLARRFAFHDLACADYYRLPPLLFAAEMLCQGSFPAPATEEQQQLVWDLARDGFAAYRSGKLTRDQGALVALVWEGRGSWLWVGLKAKLAPVLRGPTAYLCGQRRLRRKDTAEARTFFETALKDAPAGSRLQRLARAELDRLKAPARR